MIIHIYLCRRGRSLTIREFDFLDRRFVYFRWAKLRNNMETTSFSLSATGDGGLEFRVHRKEKVQGWRLRGPIEHFESAS